MSRGLRRGAAAIASALVALAAVVAAGGGCELVVGQDLPAFACDPGHDVCPGNEICNPNTNQCVVPCESTACRNGTTCDPASHLCIPVEAGPPGDDVTVNEASDTSLGDEPDAMVRDDEAATIPVDVATDTPTTLGALGAPCSGPASCQSGVCADQLTITQSPTPNLFTVAGGNDFCTQPCCTSKDCDEHTVCVATGVGGSYCMLPSWVGRSSTFGTGLGGAPCSSNAQCRSGLCSGTTCADTCCSTNASSGPGAECASGNFCRIGTFPGATSVDKNEGAYCGPGGTGQNGSSCTRASDCESELCDNNFNGTCRNACRNTTDCGGGQVSCAYVQTMMGAVDIVAACFPGAGNQPEGASCSSDGQCQSQFCSTNSQACTDVCFADTDCSKPGWHCRPEQFTLQGGGSYKVLACGS